MPGRRAPYADQVMLLDDRGHISEADNADQLVPKSHGSGPSHVKDADHESAATERTQQRSQTALAGQAMVADMKYQAQTARRLGDSALYGFYAGAVGWSSLALFVASMGIFAFCSSFPSMSSASSDNHRDRLTNMSRHLVEMVGRGEPGGARR